MAVIHRLGEKRFDKWQTVCDHILIGGTDFASESLQEERSELKGSMHKLHTHVNATCLLESRDAELALRTTSSPPNMLPTSISDKFDAASVTTKKDAVRNHAKLFQPRLTFTRQRRESCYQCRLSLNLDSNIWKGLRRKKVGQGVVIGLNLDRSGRHNFRRPPTPGSTTDDGERTRSSLVQQVRRPLGTVLGRMQR